MYIYTHHIDTYIHVWWGMSRIESVLDVSNMFQSRVWEFVCSSELGFPVFDVSILSESHTSNSSCRISMAFSRDCTCLSVDGLAARSERDFNTHRRCLGILGHHYLAYLRIEMNMSKLGFELFHSLGIRALIPFPRFSKCFLQLTDQVRHLWRPRQQAVCELLELLVFLQTAFLGWSLNYWFSPNWFGTCAYIYIYVESVLYRLAALLVIIEKCHDTSGLL